MRIVRVKAADLFVLEEIESSLFDIDGFSVYILRQYLKESVIFDKIIDPDVSKEIIGFIIMTELTKVKDKSEEDTFDGRIGHLDNIAIRRKFQSNGYGSKLLESSLSRLRKVGFTSVTLEVKQNNQQAINFYKKHGFKIVKDIGKYYASQADAYVMKKTSLF